MSTNGLKERIKGDMVQAMRDKDKDRLGVIRMLQAAIKQREVDERVMVEDAGVVAIIEKMIKQRREAAKLFEEGARPDLAEKEKSEIVILEVYMPQALSDEELSALIQTTVSHLGASSIKDMGKVMNALKDQVQGRADMSVVSQRIKQILS